MTVKLRLLLWYMQAFRKDDLSLPAAKIRAANERELPRTLKLIDFAPLELASVRDEQIEMRDRERIRVRIYKPSQRQNHIRVYLLSPKKPAYLIKYSVSTRNPRSEDSFDRHANILSPALCCRCSKGISPIAKV